MQKDTYGHSLLYLIILILGMVAFSVFGFDVYRYGLIYLLSFLVGYTFLLLVGRSGLFSQYEGITKLLSTHLDDFFITVMLGVLIGGRLGHVFLYDRRYFKDHLIEILYVRDGGMSIIGGILGVTIGTIILARWHRIKFQEILTIGDLLLCVAPFGILVGRIGNFLNQELMGRPFSELSEYYQHLFSSLGLIYTYENVDLVPRVNTNFIQSGLEGGLTLIVSTFIFSRQYVKRIFRPGLITGCFLVVYSLGRFRVEDFKDIPETEVYGLFSVSQWSMFVFGALGVFLIVRAFRLQPLKIKSDT